MLSPTLWLGQYPLVSFNFRPDPGNSQGRILAAWTLAAELPNSDLNFAVDFGVDFFPPLFSKEKLGKKSRPDPCSVDFGRETPKSQFEIIWSLRLLNALDSEDRGLKVRFFPCDDSI